MKYLNGGIRGSLNKIQQLYTIEVPEWMPGSVDRQVFAPVKTVLEANDDNDLSWTSDE